jgi:hypothetical protein
VATGVRKGIRLIDYCIEDLLPDFKNGKHGFFKAMQEMMERQVGPLAYRMEVDREERKSEMKAMQKR